MSTRSNVLRLAVFGLLITRAPRSVRRVVAFMALGALIAVAWIIIATTARSEDAPRYWPSWQEERALPQRCERPRYEPSWQRDRCIIVLPSIRPERDRRQNPLEPQHD
jgi:hypothetical protein